MGCAHVWMTSVGAKIWFKELVLTTLLQHTMIGCEDNVATNHEHCSKFYYPDKRL